MNEYPTCEVILPVSLLPEAEPLHILVGVAERRVPVRGPIQVEVPQLREVGPDDLVGVNEEYLLDVEGEHDVEEEDLVAPDDALLLLLLVQPPRPLVLHVLVLEAVLCGERRQEVAERGREVVLQDPELDGGLGVANGAQHHYLEQAFVQVALKA